MNVQQAQRILARHKEGDVYPQWDIGESIAVIPVYLGFVETPMTAQNDFPMPFIVSPELAAANVMKKLEKRPLRINFPWRLHALLSLFSRMEIIWYSFIVPRLRRTGGVN